MKERTWIELSKMTLVELKKISLDLQEELYDLTVKQKNTEINNIMFLQESIKKEVE